MECCEKKKERTEEEKKDLNIRINKIIGQMNGIKKMIEDNRYCKDILIQVTAVSKSVKSLASNILKTHLETCVVEEIKKGHNDIIEEMIDLFNRI